jgi:hypothetical protein
MNYAFDLTQIIAKTNIPSILPGLVPIGPVVPEENIKIEKVTDGRPVVANAYMMMSQT